MISSGLTVCSYFGDIGQNSETLTSYFEQNGARKCDSYENPAEWMLDIIGAAPGSQNTIDWPQVWRESKERQQIKIRLVEMQEKLAQEPIDSDPTALRPFAADFNTQLVLVTRRVFEQYWRTPSYLYSKFALGGITVSPIHLPSHPISSHPIPSHLIPSNPFITQSLFIGFSFWASPNSLQGLQNQLFSIFMLFNIFSSLVQQIMPLFVTQRSLYEVRERPSKTYSWPAFMLSNIIAELPWQTLLAVIIYFGWYYPVCLPFKPSLFILFFQPSFQPTLLSLLLTRPIHPDRSLPQRHPRRPGRRTGRSHVSLHLGLHDLRLNLQPHGHCWYRKRRNGRQHR